MFELRDVTAGYGDTVVLSNVSLQVPPGTVVALLGANGAGKTTLLRVASGLLRPRSGRICLDGDDLGGRPPHEFARRGICHVPEGRGIFRSLSVRDNLLIQAPVGSETDAVDRAVDAFPVLGRRMGQLAGTLSGGEQQMLALSRAVLGDPSLVFLDEVSLGLAPIVVDEIFQFLDGLARSGAALLLVEQYVARALALADFVFVLNRGRLAFIGEPGELDEEDVFRTYVGAAL